MKKMIIPLLLAIICVLLVMLSQKQTNSNDTNNPNASDNNSIFDNAPIIKIGEKQTSNKYEFYIDYVRITDDVLPPQPADWYSHYQAEAGKVYVDLCVAYKNTDVSAIGADTIISGKLIYDGKYEYKGFAIIEKDNRSDFTYANITSIAPLTTEYVHYLFEVPEEVNSSNSKIVLNMNIGEKDCRIIVREGNGTTTEDANKQPGKTSGPVALKEAVITKNAEFYVDYSDITKDVLPPQPADWYSHYVADDGKVYVDICFAYKNTSGKSVGADNVISAKLKYAGKYEYNGFATIEEDNRSDFTYANITGISPLSTEYVHYLFEVPEEVQSSKKSVEITFTIDGNTYTYKVK